MQTEGIVYPDQILIYFLASIYAVLVLKRDQSRIYKHITMREWFVNQSTEKISSNRVDHIAAVFWSAMYTNLHGYIIHMDITRLQNTIWHE